MFLHRGLTLTELLTVCVILLLLSTLALSGYRGIVEEQELAQCRGRMRQALAALQLYAQDWRDSFPAAEPPAGFGDLANWGDLWSASDVPGGYYFSTAPTPDGTLRGNRTERPRLPRLLSDYVSGELRTLHCPGRGSSQYWPEVGPFYYNVTRPWDMVRPPVPGGLPASDCGVWMPYVQPLDRNPARESIIACFNPELACMLMFSWRHGERDPGGAQGLNNHGYADGSVRTLAGHLSWQRPD